MRTKILAYNQYPHDSVSFYRGVLPLSEMERLWGVQVDYLDNSKTVGWSSFVHYNWFFATRPCTDKELTMLKNAKIAGCKIWIDFDDDCFSIPMSNKAFSFYDENKKNNMRMALLLADCVTVTNNYLRDRLVFESGFRAQGKVHVVPNAETKFHQCNVRAKDTNKIIWRGSDTHAGDLLTYKDEIKKILETFPDMKFQFWGWNPWPLHDLFDGRSFTVHSYPDPVQYLSGLSHCDAAVGIVPLVFDDFNMSKSNIAEIEFNCAGIIPVVPMMEGWKSPNKYETVGDFSRAVIEAVRHGEYRKQKFTQLNEATMKRYEIIMGS